MKLKERILIWLAWALPNELAYWCAVRVGCYATQGQYGHQVVPRLGFFTALRRWKH